MIFFFGTISILQLLLFPGLIIVSYLKSRSTFIYKLILTIFSSLIFNYFLITFLISLKIYSQELLMIIIVIEIFIISKLLRDKEILLLINKKNYIQVFFIILSIKLILIAFYKNTGNVFYAWDALVSFNEWAKEFSTMSYHTGMVRPDLIPKLWSLTYVLIDNTNIQFFAKFTTVIFPVLIILMNLDDILSYNKLSDYFKFILYLSFFYFHRNFILTGYVDIPLLTFVAYFFYIKRRSAENFKSSLLMSLTILSACAIKISSIFLLPIYFLTSKKNYVYFFSTLFFAIIYIIILYKKTLFGQSFINYNSIFNEMGQMSNFNIARNINYAYFLLSKDNLIYLFILSFLSAIFIKQTRINFFLFILPGFLYWLLFLSYDSRNILFVVPALILAGSMLLEKIVFIFPYASRIFNADLFSNKKILIKSFKQLNIFYFLIFMTLLTLAVSNEIIIDKHHEKTLDMLGNNELNEIIIKKINNKEINEKNFITDYQILFFVPGIKETLNYTNNYYTDIDHNIEEKEYYLIYGHAPKLRKSAKIQIKNKEKKILFKNESFLFVGKN